MSGGKGHHWLVAHSVLVFESQKNEGTIKKDLAKHNRTQVGLQYYDPLGKHSTVMHDTQFFVCLFFYHTPTVSAPYLRYRCIVPLMPRTKKE